MENTLIQFFWKGFETAINIRRRLSIFASQEHLQSGASDGVSLYGDNIDLMHQHRVAVDCGTMNDLELSPTASQSLVNVPLLHKQEEQALPNVVDMAPPSIPREDPKIVVTMDDQARTRFGLLITERLVENCSKIAQKSSELERYDGKLRKMDEKVHKLENMVRKAKPFHEDDEGDDALAKEESQMLQNMLSDLKEKQEDLKLEKSDVEGNIKFIQRQVLRAIGDALDEADILKKSLPPVNDSSERSDEGSENGDGSLIADRMSDIDTKEPALTDEEKVQNAAQANFENMQEAYFDCQNAFDSKEWQHQEESDQWEQDVANGETDETQTNFDLRMLTLDRRLTRDLADAQQAYLLAGKAVGHFNVFLGYEDDDIYDITAKEEIDPVDDFIPLSDASGFRILAWIESVDESDEADDEPMVDDWGCRTVHICDSTSLVDDDQYRREIDQLAKVSEEKRKEFGTDVEDVWSDHERPSKRRRTCTL
ncbi:uncharacterized protein KY384_002626 [Bacidia gigantensis]|uniref:uncharacterized protein n=1 Tax=Bacidia gigantensis TaxID=2732470 RepID=UPI001D052B47|nr:uncharacterized protein KY384_002626 [Bacidia gigantensis]KAG8532748.1 hypothetical protein KY384_002626 [Bacidia gigantensis]